MPEESEYRQQEPGKLGSGRRWVAVWVILVTACVAWPSDVVQAQVSAKALAQGDSLYAAFENEAALAVYERLFMQDSTDFGLLYRLSRTANDHGQDLLAHVSKKEAEPVMARSTRYAEAMRRHHPDRPETWFQLAATWGNFALFKGGRDKVRLGRDVETYALKALELDPDYAYAHLALGIFYREIGALNWFQRTVANTLFGGVPDGSNEKALRSLQRALELDPTLVMTHSELARTHRLMGDEARERYHLGRVLELDAINTDELRRQQEARRRLLEMDKP